MILSLPTLVLASIVSGTPPETLPSVIDGHTLPSLASFSLLGVSPLTVDQAGATHYAYSQQVSLPDATAGPVYTTTGKIQIDAGRVVEENTYTLAIATEISQEQRKECVHLENGTSVCEFIWVMKDSALSTTFTALDVTFTGTPSAWVTIKNVETALSTDNDQGGADNTWGRASLLCVLASFGVGAALVLV
ncbi:hypothetical protein BKA70DRAFT_1218930 [Coprinopsis sp. MPI-PUGE-AT-0042]|nr:hypothetical protein BKA70DRAFT_1218930 [Coprinopsis sp. MPI-PUGE-AT-0042]